MEEVPMTDLSILEIGQFLRGKDVYYKAKENPRYSNSQKDFGEEGL